VEGSCRPASIKSHRLDCDRGGPSLSALERWPRDRLFHHVRTASQGVVKGPSPALSEEKAGPKERWVGPAFLQGVVVVGGNGFRRAFSTEAKSLLWSNGVSLLKIRRPPSEAAGGPPCSAQTLLQRRLAPMAKPGHLSEDALPS